MERGTGESYLSHTLFSALVDQERSFCTAPLSAFHQATGGSCQVAMSELWFIAATTCLLIPLATYLSMFYFRKRKDFNGLHIFITGGSQGIGFSLARKLYQRGANVSIAARTRSKLDEAVRQIQMSEGDQWLPGSIQAYELDVTDLQQVRLPALQ